MSRSRVTTKARGRGVALATSILAALLLVPATASATYDPVGVGQTTLTLAAPFVKELRHEGVKLRVTEGARLHGSSIGFPTAAGRIDPKSGQGTVKHAGALAFSKGKRKVLLKGLILKTSAHRSPLAAKIGGGQLKLGTSNPIAVSRLNFGLKAKATDLRLSANFAARLDRKLRLKTPFTSGEPLGTALSRVEPQLASIAATGRAYLTFDPNLLAKLNRLHVAVNPIFPAEHIGAAFELPVSGGQIAPNGKAGEIVTAGSLEALQLGGGQVFWRESRIDLDLGTLDAEADAEPSPPYAGKVGVVPLATLTLTALSSNPAKRTVSLTGVLGLGAVAAAQMNQAYAQGKSEFAAGEALGSVAVTVEGE